MLTTFPHLSVWEISCRSHDLDPDGTDISNIPLEVKDSLRAITRAFDYEERFALLNSTGLERYRFRDDATGNEHTHEAVREALRDCYEKAIFNKYWLKLAFVEQYDYGNWCLKHKLPLPAFWFPDNWQNDEIVPNNERSTVDKPRPAQSDKGLCQAIAKTLWEVYPSMTIADMCKHSAIQRHGNGRLYQGQHTLRDWLSEVAPEDIKGKRGRPRKSETQQ